MDLPGFTKDEITAELKGWLLTVSATKGLDKDEQEKETGKVHPPRALCQSCRPFLLCR